MNTTGGKIPPLVNLHKDIMPLAGDQILLADSEYNPRWSIKYLFYNSDINEYKYETYITKTLQ